MPFASTSTAALRGRMIPLAAASGLTITAYTIHAHACPILADSLPLEPTKRLKSASPISTSPYTPLGWGNNRYMTLSPDPNAPLLRRPAALPHLGTTPLRDLVIAEKYGACVDAKGDCWMWGAGYDPSGQIGRSLRGKKLKTLAPGRGKIIALSRDGKLYVFSASKAFQDSSHAQTQRSWWNYLFGTNPGIDFVELSIPGGLKRGEKWTDVSTGSHHLLAVTSKGRAFSLPLSPSANTHRQLGTRQVFETPFPVASSLSSAIPLSADLPPEFDPRFCTTLTEIPSLIGIEITQVATSDRTSFVRTPQGRVLGFGANESGQIGLGSNATVEIVPVPVEVVLARNYTGGTVVKCLDVQAGGQMTMFTVESQVPGKNALVELLACGNGMNGALGNGLWSSAAGAPVKVKTVSGLTEYSEKTNSFLPLGLHKVSLSKSSTSHVFAVLDTVSEADSHGVNQGIYGKDVMVWGGNVDYQLGNGKRSSLAVPQHLPRLVTRATDVITPTREAGLNSGALTHMPHSRLQLHESRANAYDLDGKLIKKNVKCEETVVAGWNASVLYNKIID